MNSLEREAAEFAETLPKTQNESLSQAFAETAALSYQRGWLDCAAKVGIALKIEW